MKEVKKETKSAEHRAFLMKHVFRNPLIWILGFANFFVYIVRFSVLDWGPSLLSQSKGVSMSHAGWLVAMFEIAGIVGMLFAGWATDKWLRGRAHRTCVFCMAGAALFVFLFWQLPADAPVWLLFLTLCAAGFCIYGPQALIGIAAAVAYFVLLKILGFVLDSIWVVFVMMALLLNEPFKKAWPLMLAVSILAPVVLYAIFGMFLKVPLPNGILSGLLG